MFQRLNIPSRMLGVVMSDAVKCPYWRIERVRFAVRVCDNLVSGVPQCVFSHFYPDDSDNSYDSKDGRVVICRHFVWTDYYQIDQAKVKQGVFLVA